jgi:hypothetical protein
VSPVGGLAEHSAEGPVEEFLEVFVARGLSEGGPNRHGQAAVRGHYHRNALRPEGQPHK